VTPEAVAVERPPSNIESRQAAGASTRTEGQRRGARTRFLAGQETQQIERAIRIRESGGASAGGQRHGAGANGGSPVGTAARATSRQTTGGASSRQTAPGASGTGQPTNDAQPTNGASSTAQPTDGASSTPQPSGGAPSTGEASPSDGPGADRSGSTNGSGGANGSGAAAGTPARRVLNPGQRRMQRARESRQADRRERAEGQLAELYRDEPTQAIDVMANMDVNRALELSESIASRQGSVNGSGECRNEDTQVDDAIMNRLARRPEFAGRWAGEIASDFQPGGRSGAPLPPGTSSPGEAVRNLLDRHPSGDARRSFIQGMHDAGSDGGRNRAGGNRVLTSTLRELSNDGPSDQAVGFLRDIGGGRGRGHLANTLRDPRQRAAHADVQTALGNFMRNLPMVGGSPRRWDDRANGVLGTFDEAIGNDRRAQRRFDGMARNELEHWSRPAGADGRPGAGMVDELAESRTRELTVSNSASSEYSTARSTANQIAERLTQSRAATNRDVRIQRLREAEQLAMNLEGRLGLELEGHASADIGVVSAGVRAELQAELRAGVGSTTGTESESTTTQSEELTQSIAASRRLAEQFRRSEQRADRRSQTIQRTIDLDRDAWGQVNRVIGALQNANHRSVN